MAADAASLQHSMSNHIMQPQDAATQVSQTSNSPSIQDSFGTTAVSVDVDMGSFVGDPCQQPGK